MEHTFSDLLELRQWLNKQPEHRLKGGLNAIDEDHESIVYIKYIVIVEACGNYGIRVVLPDKEDK